jgi:hypothetical protein
MPIRVCTDPVKGSTVVACAVCGDPIWIAPSSRGPLAFGIKPWCLICVLTEHRKSGSPVPAIQLTDAQITEALAEEDVDYDALFASADRLRELFK